MIDQNELYRRRALGSFADLVADVTIDPAVLLFLSGIENRRRAPNENYARELMELFTLGADRRRALRHAATAARAAPLDVLRPAPGDRGGDRGACAGGVAGRTWLVRQQGGQRGRDVAALVRELAMGEAHDAVAEHRQPRVARAVALERRPRPVRLVAVGLHDEACFAPEEVDLIAIDDRVDLRAGNARGVAQVAHERLEVGARDHRLVVDRRGNALQRARAGP